MEIKDLLGAGQIGEKLLATLERATGTLYRPLGVRLEAAAEAYKTRLLGKAEAEAEADKQRALARAEADRKLILAATDEEIAERAIRREWARKLQEQRNLDTIVTQAALLAESAVYRYPMSPWSSASSTTLRGEPHAPARPHAGEASPRGGWAEAG